MTITFLANSKDGNIMNQASKGNSKAKRLGIRKSKPSLKGFRFLENYISGNPTIRYYVVQICPKNEKQLALFTLSYSKQNKTLKIIGFLGIKFDLNWIDYYKNVQFELNPLILFFNMTHGFIYRKIVKKDKYVALKNKSILFLFSVTYRPFVEKGITDAKVFRSTSQILHIGEKVCITLMQKCGE